MVHLSKVTKDAEADNLTLKKLHINDAIHNEFTTSVYGSRFAAQDLPKLEMPEQEMPREVAYRLIHDDLSLDGNPILKYDAYVLESAGHGHLLLTVEPVWRALLRRTCPQEDEAEKLMLEAMPKNLSVAGMRSSPSEESQLLKNFR
ncbi:MAG: hypothetical protein M1823_004317 [Watsoniomyces obsoletus]|nr:MAG: hypothetical protein M1823_004317 [Watsoniomyces obsoletus]